MKNKNLLTYLVIFSIIMVFSIILINAQIKDNTNKETGPSYLKTITLNELEQLIEDKETFILFIGSTECGACKLFTPNLEAVLTKYKIKINYIAHNKLDNEERSNFQHLIQFDSYPTVVFFENGIENSTINRIVGAAPQNKIIEKLKDNGYIE
ncbi:MAG: thioredoxin family protein [Bacilli bacterium]|jgi:predicted bacteriocin transport accessory protein